ncbi:hypothetical protein [Paenibacillus methanolicus]|uniref:Uncharacterized protein n=1 Tax=Paenibacillus methanolicus TaxID=582686 RepID=A0A5S5BYI4_9BACL|nr:hypothetical protein [Paenibacillus methanolicus]TYP72084.1 hypothetical protein BCM02_109363 [Paenibacillus methanolicus]
MQTLLLIIFVAVLLTGIILGVIFRKKKGAFILIILSIFLINVPVMLLMTSLHERALKKEMAEVINQHGGELKSIDHIQNEDTPFGNEYNKYNDIYRVSYYKNNVLYIAWYRAVKTVNNIHDQDPSPSGGGYGEKWLFNE